MKEIIFLHPYIKNQRCHAKIVNELSVEPTFKNRIGEIDGYTIYKTHGVRFDQFGFEAIKEG